MRSKQAFLTFGYDLNQIDIGLSIFLNITLLVHKFYSRPGV